MIQTQATRKGAISIESVANICARQPSRRAQLSARGCSSRVAPGRRCCALVCTVAFAVVFACGCERTPTPSKAPRQTSSAPPATAPRGAENFGLYVATETAQPGYGAMQVEMPASTVYVADVPVLTGADVSTATVEPDENGRSRILIQFVQAAQEKLAQATHDHLKERLAIVVEGKVLMAPRVEDEISHGAMILTGDFTAEEFERIAKVISGK